jgi:hypothetical protein
MIDLSNLKGTISQLFNTDPATQSGELGSLIGLLQSAGIQPDMLQGLDQAQILELLAQHGIDPGQFDFSQLNEALQGSGISDQLTGLASSWINFGKS